MRLPFLRRSGTRDEPLIVAMTGVRLGEAVIFAGRSAGWAIPLATRTGLSGRCLVLGSPDVTAAIEAAASRAGVVVETATTAPRERVFDLAVVEIGPAWEAAAQDVLRAVRPGGRLVTVSAAPRSGLFGKLGGSPAPSVGTDAVVARLTRFGWDGVRSIGERDGVRFIEAFTRT
jgi:SAM-dependent methyltransferase